MDLIDFTNTNRIINKYGGADNKITIIYNDKMYMLKKPSIPKNNVEASYTNNIYSEYIGCHIFDSIGITTQKTILGIYQEDNKVKNVCACEDFTESGKWRLVEFQKLKNSFSGTSTSSNGQSTSLEEILEVINNHEDIKDRATLKNFFWDMFIVDSLIGNFDRHNGNWGILVDDNTGRVKLAPVYDCGSCMFAQLTDEQMSQIINNKGEINNRVYNRPQSTITINNKKINYYEFINSMENNECNEALLRIVPKIDMKNIENIIDNIGTISKTRKTFYKTILNARYNEILAKPYKRYENNTFESFT